MEGGRASGWEERKKGARKGEREKERKNLLNVGDIEDRRENDTQIGNRVVRAIIGHKHTKVIIS